MHSLRHYGAYAALAMPLAMLGLPLYVYLPTFYTQSVGLSVSMVGLVLFLSRLSDVITDPLVGVLSDRAPSRKPFLIFGALVLIISYYALLHPPKGLEPLWLLGTSIVVYLGWSLVSIPYLAWSAEFSSHYHEKTRFAGARESATIIGAIIALSLPTLYGVADAPSQSLQLLFVAFVILMLLTLPLTLSHAPSKALHVKRAIDAKALAVLLLKTPRLLRLQSAFLLNALANALPATLFLLYVELVLQRPDATGLLLLLYFAAGVFGLPLWSALAKQIGKRRSWMASMLLASASFLFVLPLEAGDTLAFGIICVISGLSLGADMALPASMQADLAQCIEQTQRNISGLLFGFWAMLGKMALALSVGLGFGILGLAGFESHAPTPQALLVLTLLYSTLPVVFKLSSLLLMRSYREPDELTPKGYERSA